MNGRLVKCSVCSLVMASSRLANVFIGSDSVAVRACPHCCERVLSRAGAPVTIACGARMTVHADGSITSRL